MEQSETYYFESISRYDKDTFKEFSKYHYRHVTPGGPGFLVVVGTMLTSLGFLGIMGAIDLNDLNDFWPLVVGIVFLAIGVNMFLGRFAAANIKEVKENRIRFFDDRIEYAGQQEQGFYYYNQIVRLRENQGYFFLYVAKNRAMMISKSGMTLGSPDQLRGFLYQKVTPQYK